MCNDSAGMSRDEETTDLHAAVDALPAPDRELFADLEGTPTVPTDAAAASQFRTSIAAQLSALDSLIRLADASALGVLSLLSDQQQDAEPLGFASLKIEELAADDATDTASTPPEDTPAVRLLLILALYSLRDQKYVDAGWSSAVTAAAAAALLHTLAAAFAAVDSPKDTQQAHVLSSDALIQASSRPLDTLQRFVFVALPHAVRRIRPILIAYSHHMAAEKTRLEPYTGPGTFERTLAAAQLAWMTTQLNAEALHDVSILPSLLPSVLACLDDPAPAVQRCGLAAVTRIALIASADALAPWAEVLPDAARKAVVGCEERVWPGAAVALVAVAAKLQGSSPYAPSLHASFTTLLQEGLRHVASPAPTLTFLHTIPTLFPTLGLQLVAHFATLMPLLLELCTAYRRDVRAAALAAVTEAVRCTWPRGPAHAVTIWGVLERVYLDEKVLAGREDVAVVAAVERAAEVVWDCGGAKFQANVVAASAAREEGRVCLYNVIRHGA